MLLMGWACSSSDDPEPNLSPTVELISGPTEGDTVDYRVPLSWAGNDADGSIDRFEYAIDPDPSFTEEEIANGGPGISSQLRRGNHGNPDTTRITKQDVFFDWIHTRETSRRFPFTAGTADSMRTERFYGLHAFYVRALDDDGAFSGPDKVAFTARTIAPRSKIFRPRQGETFAVLGDSLHASWLAYDPDGPGRRTKGIYYALVHPIPPMICLGSCPPGLLIGEAPWTFVGEDTTSLVIPLEVPTSYVFAIRAVDENGAVEPFVDWRRNAIMFGTREGAMQPALTISFEGHSFTFPNPSETPIIRLPAQREAVLRLRCSAELYGESCTGFRWGWDARDLGAWKTEAEIRISSPHAGTYVFYVEARDSLGNTTLATLILHAIDFSFDREVLIVDDCFDNLNPRDSEHDAFWRDMVASYVANSDIPATQFFHFAVHGDGDQGNLQPSPPLLSDLAKYKLVIWENHGSGYNGDSGLLRAASLSPTLSLYLKAGGKLWLGGRMTVGATTPAPNLLGADLVYPKEELIPGDWAYDFLKLHSTKINNDKGGSRNNLLHSVWPFRAAPVVYDSMVVDVTKLPLLVQQYGGFSHSDAVWDPIFAESEPEFRGDLDSLYAYGAAGPEVQGRTSQYHGRLTAIRWHDPDPDREHGRIQWFGFSMYFMRNEQAARTFKQSLDWLREEEPPQ